MLCLSRRALASVSNIPCRQQIRKAALPRSIAKQAVMETSQTTKIWIDCDAGVDDAQGIMLATSDPSCQLMGVSCVFGNTDVHQVSRNVCRILTLCGRCDIPVYAGCHAPLLAQTHKPNWWFGHDGLGDATQAFKPRRFAAGSLRWSYYLQARPQPQTITMQASHGHAAMKIVECARENEGQLTVVATGPLTNIALACKLDPSLPSRLQHLVVMGSAEAVGNVTPTAEFNFHADAEAAAVVLGQWSEAVSSGRPCSLRVVSWECCEKHPVPWNVVDRWLSKETARARFLAAIAEQSIASCKASKGGARGWECADPLAVAVAVRPSIVMASKHVACRVETQGSDMVRGMAVYDWNGVLKQKPNLHLVTTVNMTEYLQMMEYSLD